MTEPKKFDTDKPRYDLLPPKALGLLVDCLTYGAKKYEDYNWRKDGGIDPNRLFAATQRHLWAWKDGETNDKESGLPHLAHAATNLLMMLDLACRPPVKIPNFNPWSETEKPGLSKEEAVTKTFDTLCLDEHSLAYDIVSEPENVRYFDSGDKTMKTLQDLELFSCPCMTTTTDGKERWVVSRTLLGHSVRDKIKNEGKPETEKPGLSPDEDAYYWLSRLAPGSWNYRTAVGSEDLVVIDDTPYNRRLADNLHVLFDMRLDEKNATITLLRTPSGHKIRSLLNAKS